MTQSDIPAARLFSENGMSWWGKLIGGGLGYAFGGPIGALIGVVLGHNLEKGVKVAKRRIAPGFGPGEQQRVQAAFFTTTFSVMGHLARSDGSVTKPEIALAKKVMKQLNLSEDQKVAAGKLFNEGKRPEFPFESVIAQFRKECHRRRNLLRMFVEIQIHAATSDGPVNADEERMLSKIANMVGFSQQEYQQLFTMVLSKQGRESSSESDIEMPQTVEEAISVLGLKRSASDEDIRSTYRRLLSQHHPDKLVSKGLPEEMIKVATAKVQQIKEAYRILQQEKEEA